ncbi:NAD(P)/FAD-dependent oxidoreductase [Pseudonocardia humida]|uniref:NAD(P)-binding domain-containing protein n=1 Tax=Pseudonocardia humida TaxID=2800819 RepID=A0ABT1A263_9PSEU|nr:NAD(P)/FAD-dependent oxidoreductase [Pseudonocardia humida]MCO1657083.1 NAD(P)-binding domain-containing protein [Pseudonocardia humida]
MTVLDEQRTSTDRNVAKEWLAAFERATTARDPQAAAALFLPDGHWRDILAFTWHLRTFSGTDQLVAAFAETVEDVAPSGFTLREFPAPRPVRRSGIDSIEALFDFRTAVGSGSGVLRVAPDEHGDPKAVTLLTALQELTGHEEISGERRPRGEAYSRNFGGRNWLDQRLAAREYTDREPAVLVVGGGQAGLGIAARLRHLGVDALVVDRMERIGDNWRKRYHSLALHNEIWVNHLPYLPFPDSWPVFVPKDKLANWFEAYVEAMEIDFWTSTEFVGADYDAEQGTWTATVRREGVERVLRPRHIVMATGVSGIPSIPQIPGIEDFAGDVLHSSGYREGSDYAGRTALVIGTGNSGHDVAQDLHSYGASVTMVQRSSTTVCAVEPTAQRVYSLYSEGLPTAECDLILASTPYPLMVRTYQLLAAEARRDDAELIAGLNAVGFRTDYGHDDTGFQMKYQRRGGGYYLNVGCSELIIESRIGLIQYADIDRLVPEGARMRDGSVVPADLIVLATGYRSQQELVRARFGDAVADTIGPIWDYDRYGELQNVWKRTAQPGLWFHAGSLAQNRIFSKFLALQIKACEVGLIEPVAPPVPQALVDAPSVV